jgi:hypothetical protein
MVYLRRRDLALALVTCNTPLLAEGLVRLELLLVLGDLAGGLRLVNSRKRDGSASGGSGEVVTLKKDL